MKRLVSVLSMALVLAAALAQAQLSPVPQDQGSVGLALALRQLGSAATFMHTTAHPDDEDNGLLVMMSRGRGLRTALLTVTRGDGGQNEIGPEIFQAIGILRTGELMAMHRQDAAEQYFTSAFEFGYSFSVEETLEKWGEEEILADIVRIIRTVRPDVIVALPTGGAGGGQHHQTTGRLTALAFRAAADPGRFPEQIAEGLRPWQPLKLYHRASMGGVTGSEARSGSAVTMDTGVYDPLLGMSYNELGILGRSNHRCQSMSQLRAFPGERFSNWVLADSAIQLAPGEQDLLDGVEIGLDRLKDFVADEEAAGFVVTGVDDLKGHVEAAVGAYDALAPWETLPPLRAGLLTARHLRQEVSSSALSEGARYELEHRLATKEEQFIEAIVLAHGIAVDPVADSGEVVPGSSFSVDVRVANRSPEAVDVTGVELVVPRGWSAETRDAASAQLQMDDTLRVSFVTGVAADAEYSRPYWQRNYAVDRFDILEPEHFGLPFSPPVVRARINFRSGDVEAVLERTVEHRYGGPWVGTEKQKEVSVLPAVSLMLSPQNVVFPLRSENRSRTVAVDVLYKGREAAGGTLRLEVPQGWTTSPAEAQLSFQRENEAATVRFELQPPASVAPGSYEVAAVAMIGDREYREGYETIAYHHVETRYLFHPARAKVQALDIEVAPVTVGYIMGGGDDVAEAARLLGADVEMLDEDDLAGGDLSRFDMIMTGTRAYLTREDLRAYNWRLLEYVEAGGTMVVQYNKFEFNDAQWGPYPALVSRNRVTVEEAPIRILEPAHPLFTYPNRITEDDWSGWVQERGLYFLGEKDSRYVDLIASEDPWEYNAGEKRGALVETRYGDGRWLYVGLGFFRQLPEGVADAYKLFANVLSLPAADRRP